MAEKSYSWKRFWCPREAGFNLGDNGFLSDPDSEYGRFLNPSLVSSENLYSHPCLALLGEPGVGKSHEINEFHQSFSSQGNNADDALLFDLRSYGEESRLCSEIFGDERFKRWLAGKHRMHLFLDSLDECLLRIQTVTSLLEEKLSRYSIERLSLRIACRTAEWPPSFELALKRLYGEESVKAYELAFLRRKDIRSAAECEGISDPDQFIDMLIKGNAVPLAIKPVTLDMLVKLYKQKGGLPSKQTELYERGCLLMCEEPNERRREIGATSSFPAEVLLAAASRIAAVTILGNCYAIWTDIDKANVPEEDVTVSELSGGNESVNGRSTSVTEDLIKAALGTGLFTSRGPHRMGWAHQTYAEFLAARYLAQSGMSEKQVMNLLVHPSDVQQKLVPQLYETAAWAAGTNSDVFDEIMAIEPEVLLRSDVASFEPEHKKRLVSSLLMFFDQERLLDRDIYQYYHKLNHPSLADQLEPYINDKSKGFLVRRVAIDIAEACKNRELLPGLTQVALDPEDDISVRINAACAVARIGDSEAKAKLRPLVFEQAGGDPEDELKGWALQACWPEHISNEELFQALRPAKNPNLVGSYDRFLYELPERLSTYLKPEDLKYALDWILSVHNIDWHFKSHWEKIRDWIIQESWDNLLRVPGLVEPFAEAVFVFLQRCEHLVSRQKEPEFNKKVVQDEEKRRLIIKAILPRFIGKDNNIHLLIVLFPLVTEKDLNWMLEQYDGSSVEEAKLWSKLIGYFYQSAFPWNFTWLLNLRHSHPLVAALVSYLFKSLGIFYHTFFRIKAFYWRRKYLSRRDDKHPPLKPSPKERVLLLLGKFEKGDSTAWWRLNREMTLEPNSRFYGNEFESDLTILPVWSLLSEKDKSRLINAAKKYILNPPSLDSSWIGTNSIPYAFLAGYRAIVLLLDKAPQFVNQLPGNTWKTWAPIFIAYPLNSSIDKGPHASILAMAYEKAPQEIISALVAIIDKENNQHGHIFITRRIEHCLDEDLAKALFDKAKSDTLKPNCKGELLDLLFEHSYKPAIEYAKSQITPPFPKEGPDRESVLVAAESLFANQPAVGWEVIKPVIENDRDFGKKVFERSARLYRHDKMGLFTQHLNEIQIADIYLWLTRQYPYEKDPQIRGAHAVGHRENIAHFRNGLLEHLKVKGTPESYQQLQRVANELPQLSWMKWVIIEAGRNTRARTWRPLIAEQIIKLAQDNRRTYVESAQQLIDVICDSLGRLERKLHGEMPAVYGLWDNRGNSRQPQYCPKDEPHLSDYIARHLSEDLGPTRGIVVNREVRIRRGQQTDIHIDAVNPTMNGGVDVIKAIIEVKGCWNPDLEAAMKSQLVGKYLRDNQCPNGLYLVGWFNCSKWTDVDYRRSSAPRYSLDEAKSHFAKQAEELSKICDIRGLLLRSYILNAGLH